LAQPQVGLFIRFGVGQQIQHAQRDGAADKGARHQPGQ
jgi:hypothetical protein